MKHTFRVIIGLIAFLVGLVAFLLYKTVTEPVANPIPPLSSAGGIILQFKGCVQQHSVFVFENNTEESVYIPLQIGSIERFREFREARLVQAMTLLEYRANGSQTFEAVRVREAGAVSAFRIILPNTSVRYGVDLARGEGIYRVSVPYLEPQDAIPLIKTNESMVPVVRDSGRLRQVWKEAQAGPIANSCNW